MLGKIGRLGILIALALVISLGVVVLALSYSEAGVTCEIGAEGFPITVDDLSAVPQPVVEDAVGLATELFGDYQEKGNDFVNQLLALYLEAEDKDFIGCILEDRPPKATGLDGKMAVKVVNVGNQSIKERKPVRLH